MTRARGGEKSRRQTRDPIMRKEERRSGRNVIRFFLLEHSINAISLFMGALLIAILSFFSGDDMFWLHIIAAIIFGLLVRYSLNKLILDPIDPTE